MSLIHYNDNSQLDPTVNIPNIKVRHQMSAYTPMFIMSLNSSGFVKQGGGAHPTKPGWSKPHTHSNPTNLALFRRKITLYIFNEGAHTIAGWGGLKWEQGGLKPPTPSL